MPQDRVEIVRYYIDRFSSGSFDASLDNVDPEVEVDWSQSRAPYGGIYRGHQGWDRLFREMREAFEASWTEIHEYIEIGPHVAIPNTGHLRGRDGIEVVARSTIVFTFRDDMVIAIRLYQNHADALAAIGAAEGQSTAAPPTSSAGSP
jgi:ketosteroid isomerase-like protein